MTVTQGEGIREQEDPVTPLLSITAYNSNVMTMIATWGEGGIPSGYATGNF